MHDSFETGAVIAGGALQLAARDRQLLNAALRRFGDGYVTFTVERGKKLTRSQKANRYYWGQVLTPMSIEGSHGDQSPEEIHDAMCTMFLPDEKKRVEFFNRLTGETLEVETDPRRSSKLTGEDFYSVRRAGPEVRARISRRTDGRPGPGVLATKGGGVMATPDDGSAFAMSLRDFFAAQFLPSLSLEIADRLIAPEDASWYERAGDHTTFAVAPAEIAARIAQAAYLIADALIAERSK